MCLTIFKSNETFTPLRVVLAQREHKKNHYIKNDLLKATCINIEMYQFLCAMDNKGTHIIFLGIKLRQIKRNRYQKQR